MAVWLYSVQKISILKTVYYFQSFLFHSPVSWTFSLLLSQTCTKFCLCLGVLALERVPEVESLCQRVQIVYFSGFGQVYSKTTGYQLNHCESASWTMCVYVCFCSSLPKIPLAPLRSFCFFAETFFFYSVPGCLSLLEHFCSSYVMSLSENSSISVIS